MNHTTAETLNCLDGIVKNLIWDQFHLQFHPKVWNLYVGCWPLGFLTFHLQSCQDYSLVPLSDMWELWLTCRPSRGLLSSEVADTRFIAYCYASVLDSNVQGISEAVNQVGLRGGKLSEQSDSSCLILGWQLSFIFPQIFDKEWLSWRMWQWRCLHPFQGFSCVIWCVDVVWCVNSMIL